MGPADQFGRFGGTAMGLLTADALTDTIPELWTAPFAVARLDELAGRPLPDFLVGHEIVLKASGLREAFTEAARRGAHSRFPRLTPRAGATWDDLFRAVRELLPAETLAIVAQRVISGDGWPEPVIVHADGLEVRIEFTQGPNRLLFHRTQHEPPALYSTAGDGGTPPAWCGPIARLHHSIAAALGFPVNTEGMVSSGGRFGLVQLRPIPPDAPMDPVLSCEIRDLHRRGALLRRTPFVWAHFDVTVDGLALLDGSDPRVTTHRPDGNGQVSGTAAAPLFLDLTGGFCLSHAIEHLPPPGPARDSFRYIGLPGLALDLLAHRRVRLLSDGRTGAVMAT